MVSHIRRIISPVLFLFCLSFTSCHIARYVYWNYADVTDYKKFPADTIQPSHHPHNFPRSFLQKPLYTPEKITNDEASKNLDQFLAVNKTLAFIILRNDTLIYEKYFK